ncbi:putative cobaltochelatase [Paludibacterium yongneupense]|uniref:putative cobaltochelatase n=1 Tax=Paludibacterium yongneupense TaxID=400061 RepID=UPI000423F1F8|nr:putative cobaltochelatase [Paludibacterium yongneupense]
MRQNYPFAAIVGQDDLKRALLLCAIDPSLGGLLIRGDKGCAKSTAARGLSDVLPPIRRVPGCAFNCAPEAPLAECPICRGGDAHAVSAPVPFVNLPLGAGEDRVLGSLDIGRALKDGRTAFQPGLLASAHRGLLYIDEVNLLPDHLVDALLDVAAMGQNRVERDGLAISHPARLTLLGTMNPEEGELRPQLLDRFGMMVEVSAPRDPHERSEVVRRRLAFESDPSAFSAHWSEHTAALRERIVAARSRLSAVRLSDALFHFISQLCCEFDVASLRADIVMNKVARAIAALAERDAVEAGDVRDAALLVLPHRRRRKPFEQGGLDRERLEHMTREAAAPPPAGRPERQDAAPTDGGTQAGDDGEPADASESGQPREQVFAAADAADGARLDVAALSAHEASGRRGQTDKARRGYAVGALASPSPGKLALGATLRHAVRRDPSAFAVTRADLHDTVLSGRQGTLLLLLVDASGSMGAKRRMEAVKASVLGLLQDAYIRRDQVAVICFRGDSAELVLAPTRHAEQAERALSELPTGGRTPLAHALQLAAETLARREKELTPLLVVLSDGRANIALTEDGNPWRESLEQAAQLAAGGTPALVLDTEQDFVRLGRARELAHALEADYLPLDRFSSEQLTLTLRERLKR